MGRRKFWDDIVETLMCPPQIFGATHSGHTWMSEGPHDDDDDGLRSFSTREVRKRPFDLWTEGYERKTSGVKEELPGGGRQYTVTFNIFILK